MTANSDNQQEITRLLGLIRSFNDWTHPENLTPLLIALANQFFRCPQVV
jgi:hypothetical protein